MALDAEAVRVGLDGRVYIAPSGTTAPTDVTSPWAAGWDDLGYLNPDGISTPYSTETENVDAWQSLSPVRKILTGVEMTFQFTCLEFKRSVVQLYFPSSSITTNSGVHTLAIPSAPDPDERAFGFEFTDGASLTYRAVVPRCEVTDRSEIQISRGGPVALQFTVTAYATSAPELAFWLTNDPNWAAA